MINKIEIGLSAYQFFKEKEEEYNITKDYYETFFDSLNKEEKEELLKSISILKINKQKFAYEGKDVIPTLESNKSI